ncbi:MULTISPECIES: hypothetical protein [Microcoleaceae]|nr:hypothetical protein [Tychonema sp. LEGE 06208]
MNRNCELSARAIAPIRARRSHLKTLQWRSGTAIAPIEVKI